MIFCKAVLKIYTVQMKIDLTKITLLARGHILQVIQQIAAYNSRNALNY